MKILFVNTLHFKHGGPSVHTFDLIDLLRKAGHDAEVFSMQHERNIPSEYSEYFPSKIDYPALLKEGGLSNALKVIERNFYSKESRKCFERMLDEFKPDIIHLQNFLHHLTLSIIIPARKRGIPIIWTLHDSVLVCPNTNLFNDKRHKACTKCDSFFKRMTYPVLYKCKKNSRGASLIAALEAISFKIYNLQKMIDLYITPSKFLCRQLKKMGFKGDNLFYLPNFADFPIAEPSEGEYAMYFGRIENEKGIFDLIEAAKRIRIPLVIAGGGSQIERLEREIRDCDRISFVGHLEKKELLSYLSDSRFSVIPSICYENAPLTLIESNFQAKPVLGANIGGIPELIDDGVTGMIFTPGDIEELSIKMSALWNDKEKTIQMGKMAQQKARLKHSPNKYIEELEKLYKLSMEKM